MPCCEEITDLGCFTSCDETLEFPSLIADVSGAWKMEAEFAGSVLTVPITAVATEAIEVENVFNEDYTVIFKLFKPDGSQFGGVCYSFTVRPNILLS